MRTVEETVTEMQSALESWVVWAQRLEAVVLDNPAECHCWDGDRNATEGHTGKCAVWREVASAIRRKSPMLPGPA
jgi:hypothetical protein